MKPYETKTPGKIRQYAELVPIDFDALIPYKKVRNTRPNFSVVYTGSEWTFWAKPKGARSDEENIAPGWRSDVGKRSRSLNYRILPL